MVACAPIPLGEVARLEDLHSYHILDTLPDERFDLFTRMSTWLYKVPVSAINLVDADRTFFKSLIGFAPYQPRRPTSICAHAVGGEDAVMIVEDLARDNRFDDHPLLLNKGLRFYAGAVLRSVAGQNLGTLCIADTLPRVFSADERQKLVEMAHGVGVVLELHRNARLLLQAANQDELTGLCNRRLFNEKLASATAAHVGERCALLCLDLDRFKQVNDRFGHAGGDALLREVGRRLSCVVRSGDVVARLGGDEFTVLTYGPAPDWSAEQLAQRVLAAFAAPFALGGESLAIHGSIGIATYPEHAADAAGLLRCADAALYAAKQAGRGRYQVYQPRDARQLAPVA